MLRIDVALSDGQGPVNEDAIGHHGNAAWVIDGATGIGPSILDAPSDAAWLAQTANRLLAEALADDPDCPTIALLRTVMTRCAEALARVQLRADVDSCDLPSAAFAMVRIIDDAVEITSLADCRVAAVDEAGAARLYGASGPGYRRGADIGGGEGDLRRGADDRSRCAEIAAVARIARQSLPEELRGRLLGLRARGRGGGPCLAGEASFAARQRFAIASDGFLRLVELFGIETPADLLAIATPGEAQAWLARLRDIEREPDSLRRHTRVKRHDDASLIVCSWDVPS